MIASRAARGKFVTGSRMIRVRVGRAAEGSAILEASRSAREDAKVAGVVRER